MSLYTLESTRDAADSSGSDTPEEGETLSRPFAVVLRPGEPLRVPLHRPSEEVSVRLTHVAVAGQFALAASAGGAGTAGGQKPDAVAVEGAVEGAEKRQRPTFLTLKTLSAPAAPSVIRAAVATAAATWRGAPRGASKKKGAQRHRPRLPPAASVQTWTVAAVGGACLCAGSESCGASAPNGGGGGICPRAPPLSVKLDLSFEVDGFTALAAVGPAPVLVAGEVFVEADGSHTQAACGGTHRVTGRVVGGAAAAANPVRLTFGAEATAYSDLAGAATLGGLALPPGVDALMAGAPPGGPFALDSQAPDSSTADEEHPDDFGFDAFFESGSDDGDDDDDGLLEDYGADSGVDWASLGVDEPVDIDPPSIMRLLGRRLAEGGDGEPRQPRSRNRRRR